MNIEVLIFGIIWPLISMVLIRPMAGHFAWKFMELGNNKYWSKNADKPDGDQWLGGTLCALGLAVVWPIVLIWMISGRFLPTVGAEKTALNKAERARFEELQKSLGLEPVE